MTALLARLHQVICGGVLLPSTPHRYTRDQYWPGGCWCSQPKDDQVHKSPKGVPL